MPVELEQFTLVPKLRCFERVGGRDGSICGHPARWMRPDTAICVGGYFCDTHRKVGDLPIAADAPFRRVRLTVDVLMSGASWSAPIAHSEALGRLDRAVRAVGGWLDVKLVTSTIGRASPSAVRRAPPADHGEP